jgi:hypothetical protein
MVRIACSSHRNRTRLGQQWAPKSLSPGEVSPRAEGGEQAGERSACSPSAAHSRRDQSGTWHRGQPHNDSEPYGDGWAHDHARPHRDGWAHDHAKPHRDGRTYDHVEPYRDGRTYDHAGPHRDNRGYTYGGGRTYDCGRTYAGRKQERFSEGWWVGEHPFEWTDSFGQPQRHEHFAWDARRTHGCG